LTVARHERARVRLEAGLSLEPALQKHVEALPDARQREVELLLAEREFLANRRGDLLSADLEATDPVRRDLATVLWLTLGDELDGLGAYSFTGSAPGRMRGISSYGPKGWAAL